MIETSRLRIRKLAAGDEPFIYELLNQSSFIENIGDRGIKTLEDAGGYIGRVDAGIEQNGVGLMAVVLKETGEPVGINGLIRRDILEHIDIGYAFLDRHSGKGYAYESSVAILEHGWNDKKLNRIVAIVKPDNARSIKLLEKLGMEFVADIILPGFDHPDKLFGIDRPE